MKSILKVYTLLTVLLVPGVVYAQAPSSTGSLAPREVYHGSYNDTTKVGLRIANGGAGQSGLIGAWANSFINYMVERKGHEPFTVRLLCLCSCWSRMIERVQVEWYLGDTTESIGFLQQKLVDVAVTYNEAAESQVNDAGLLSAWLYGFRVSRNIFGVALVLIRARIGPLLFRWSAQQPC